MNHQEVSKKIQDFLKKESGNVGESLLNNKDSLLGSGLFDSIIIVSLIGFCEEEFDIVFDFTEVDESIFESIDSISDYIVSRI